MNTIHIRILLVHGGLPATRPGCLSLLHSHVCKDPSDNPAGAGTTGQQIEPSANHLMLLPELSPSTGMKVSSNSPSKRTSQDPISSIDLFLLIRSSSLDKLTLCQSTQHNLVFRTCKVHQTHAGLVLLCARRIDNPVKITSQNTG